MHSCDLLCHKSFLAMRVARPCQLCPASEAYRGMETQTAASCAAGQNTGGWDTEAEVDMLRKVFDVAAAVPASLLSSCVISLLAADSQNDSLQCVRCCASWWQDDSEDFTHQLQNLLRGGLPAVTDLNIKCMCSSSVCVHADVRDHAGARVTERLSQAFTDSLQSLHISQSCMWFFRGGSHRSEAGKQHARASVQSPCCRGAVL